MHLTDSPDAGGQWGHRSHNQGSAAGQRAGAGGVAVLGSYRSSAATPSAGKCRVRHISFHVLGLRHPRCTDNAKQRALVEINYTWLHLLACSTCDTQRCKCESSALLLMCSTDAPTPATPVAHPTEDNP